MPGTPSFYPNLGTIVKVDHFPEELQFIQDGLQNLLDKLYYKHLQFSKSNDGAQANYSLVLISNTELRVNLFNSGFALIINPGATGETLVPVTLNYNWPIIGVIKNFDLASFSFLPQQMQDLLHQTASLSDVSLVETAVQTFENGNNLDAFKRFVDKINQFYNLSGPNLINYPVAGSETEMADGIRLQVDANTVINDAVNTLLSNIYVGNTDVNVFRQQLDAFSKAISGFNIGDYIRNLVIPRIDASLELSVGLAFPRSILLPLTAPVAAGGTPLPEPEQAVLVYNIGKLLFSTQGGINFEKELDASLNHPCQIGKTGLGIELQKAKIDLSRKKNIPEANLDGRPADFMGVYFKLAAITLPARWFHDVDQTTARIAGYNILAGTGGLSGTIALEALGGDNTLWAKIGNWRLGFMNFDITFKQNTVTSSNIKAALEVPRFKSGNDPLKVNLEGHLFENGDFSLTGKPVGGVQASLFNFVDFNFLSFELGRKEDNFFIGTSCEIKFINPIMKKLLKDQVIKLSNLRIYSDGHIELVTGNVFLPVNLSLHLGPIDIAVTGIYFGSYQHELNGQMRKYNYFGLDGAINLGSLGVDAKGKGIKYYFTVDDGPADNFIRVESIELDLVIPGSANPASAVALIHGAVSIPAPGDSPEYVGEISIKLPKAKIAGGAAMKLQPKAPAFVIDAFIDLPAPIPLGPVGIYGFRGLLGYRYVAEKEAAGLVSGVNTWYEYYKKPPKGIHVSKFSGPERTKNYSFPFSIGAGAVLGTSFDSGTIISIRAMLLLSIPTLFMIEGRASILSARLGLTDDREPPFFAFIAWGDHSLELGIGADFKLPQSSGWIVDLYAEVQAGFFFNNASRWYVNFGTKQQPISARVLSILTAQTYLMLSSKGIEAGARVEFDLNKHFGPAKVHIYAYVEVGGHISFERPQIGGYLAFGGMIDIEIWIIGITLGLDALLSVEAAKPFLLYAELRIRVCVRIIVKVCKSFTVELKWEKDSSVDRTPIAPLPRSGSDAGDRTGELVKAVHMITNEVYNIKYFSSVPDQNAIVDIIPMDSFIDIKTAKGLIPTPVDQLVGGHTTGAENYTDLVSPESISRSGRQLRQVKHTYSIESISIKAWNGSQWVDYHPYQAIIEGENVTNLKIGYWQRSGNQYDTIRLLATTPFSYTQAGEPGWFIPEQYGINPSTLFCATQQETHHCSNVLNKPIGTIYYPPQQYVAHLINGAYYTLTGGAAYDPSGTGIAGLNGDYMKVTADNNPFGFAKSLSFNNYNSMVIFLPDPSVSVKLKLTTNASGADISYYAKIINNNTSSPQYQLLQTVHKTASELQQQQLYENFSSPVSKVVITPTAPNPRIAEINAEIAALFNNTYENSSGQVNISQPSDMATYMALLAELARLMSQGCSSENMNYFSYFFGYMNTLDITQAIFREFVRVDDFYVAIIEIGLPTDTMGTTTSLLLKINGNGQVIGEKLLSGVVQHIIGAAGYIYISLAKRYTIDYWLEIPVLLKLDAALNQVGGLELSPVFVGTTDTLCPVQNGEYIFWFGSNMRDRVIGGGSSFMNGSRIILVHTATMNIADQKLIFGDLVMKAVQKDETTCVFITAPSWIVNAPPGISTVSVTASGTIDLQPGHFSFDATLNDIAVLANGEIIVTGRISATGQVFTGLYEPGSNPATAQLYAFTGTELGTEELYIGTGTIQAGGVFATIHNSRNVFVLTYQNGITLYRRFLLLTPPILSGPEIFIRELSNNPVTGEVYMIADNASFYKGGLLTVMNEEFQSCILQQVSITGALQVHLIDMTHYTFSEMTDPTLYYPAPGMIGYTPFHPEVTQVCVPVPQPAGNTRCTTALQQICWLTVAQHEYNYTIPGQAAIQEDQGTMVAAMQKTAQPIWRPNTKFYVHFRLKDTVDNGSSTPGLYDYYYGFKTTGPVGHFVVPGGNANHPLASLRKYIDYNRSYPNADGDLLQAKPLFYGNDQCKISVFFAYAFAYHMLQKWYAYNGMPELTGEMHIAIKDPVTDVVVPYPLPVGWTSETVPLPDGSETWSGDNDPRIPHNIQMLNNMINYVNQHNDHIQCVLSIGQPIVPKSYTWSVKLTNLAPSKLYTAILYNAFEADSNNVVKSKQVHEFVFQTSRYASFDEQVNSFILKDDANNQKQAVFAIPVTVTAAKIDTAWNIVAGNPDPQSNALQTKYAHLFDRVTEGLFGFTPNDPAVTTEFNVLKDTVTGDVIGILVRNPEPFNIPKIPVEKILDTISVLGQGAQPDASYKVLYSKDYAQALVMHTSKKITAPGLSFRFIYKIWNGSDYIPASTINTVPVALNI